MVSWFKKLAGATRYTPQPSKKSVGKYVYRVEHNDIKGKKHNRNFKYKKLAVAYADLLKLSNSKTPAKVYRSDQLEDGYVVEDVEVYDNAQAKKT